MGVFPLSPPLDSDPPCCAILEFSVGFLINATIAGGCRNREWNADTGCLVAAGLPSYGQSGVSARRFRANRTGFTDALPICSHGQCGPKPSIISGHPLDGTNQKRVRSYGYKRLTSQGSTAPNWDEVQQEAWGLRRLYYISSRGYYLRSRGTIRKTLLRLQRRFWNPPDRCPHHIDSLLGGRWPSHALPTAPAMFLGKLLLL